MMPMGYKLTEEQRNHPSKFKKGQIAWNKGTGGCKKGHDQSLYVPMPKTGVHVCLGCKRENGAKYRKKNKHKPAYIIRNRVGRYNISIEDYNDLLGFQEAKCAICGISLTLKNCRIDHDHSNSQVRGLLCVACNTGIGLLKESVEFLSNAIKYLEASNEPRIYDKNTASAPQAG